MSVSSVTCSLRNSSDDAHSFLHCMTQGRIRYLSSAGTGTAQRWSQTDQATCRAAPSADVDQLSSLGLHQLVCAC